MKGKNNFYRVVADCFCPSFCLRCGGFGATLCAACQQHLPFLPQSDLSSMLRSSWQQHSQHWWVDSTQALFCYHSLIAHLMKRWKYQGERDCARDFAFYLWQYLWLPAVDVVTFTPMHWRRQRERGYNQAEDLAHCLANYLQVPCVALLQKFTPTPHQAALGRQERMRLMRQKLKVIGNCARQRVLLLDDVITTGATINQAARSLKLAGARQVAALAVAYRE